MRLCLLALFGVLVGLLAGEAKAGNCARVTFVSNAGSYGSYGSYGGFSAPLVLRSYQYQPQPQVAFSRGTYGGVSSCDPGVMLGASGYAGSPVLLAPSYGYGSVGVVRSFRSFGGGYGHNDVAIVNDGYGHYGHNDVAVVREDRGGGGLIGAALRTARNIVGEVLGGPRGGSVSVQSGNTKVQVRSGRRGR